MAEPGPSIYEGVTHKKVPGRLLVSDTGLAFHPNSNTMGPPTHTVPWSILTKHQVSPVSYPRSLLKLVLADGKSTTFQLSSRPELEGIRKEVTTRLSTLRATQQRPGASSKKRSHAEMATPPVGKTTATSFGELDPTALAVTRSSLLAANPGLRTQHQYLVQETQTLTEEDFWKTHQDLLEEEYARISGMTRAGTSSLLQSHLQLLTGRVTLGVEEMRQIFILYPAVHKAYEEKVPLELSDEQFWRKYLESEYFHRDRGRIGAASRSGSSPNPKTKSKGPTLEEQEARAAAVGTDDIFSRYDQKLRETKNSEEGSRKWGTNLAVGQFDLAATFATERGNLLEGPKDNHPNSNDSKGAKVIQKYNRHWAMVMHPEDAVAGSDLLQVARQSVKDVLPNDQDAQAGGGLDEEMHKLVGFASASSSQANHALGIGDDENLEDYYEPLTLKNIEVYYSLHRDTTTTTTSKASKMDENEQRKRNMVLAETIVGKMKALEAMTAKAHAEGNGGEDKIGEAFPPSALATNLLKALTKKMAEDSKTDEDTLEVVNALPEDFKKKIHSYFRRTSELLRHFFGLRKLAETNQNNAYAQKLKRIVTGMETVYRDIEGMQKEFEATGDLGKTMRKMCLQIMDQVERAFKLHREGTGGSGGGGFVTIEEF